MDVASLTISLLPIINATSKNYQSLCARPFSRYSAFSREVERYLSRLDNQRVIFRCTCFHLLSDVVESEDAELMLATTNHQYWSNQGLENQLVTLLGESQKQCIRTLEQIEKVLDDIEGKRLELSQALERENEVCKRFFIL
jgi:hypothetical protein